MPGIRYYPSRRGYRIKSIQRGTFTWPDNAGAQTITISAVDTALTEVYYLGGSNSASSSTVHNALANLVLASSTTITATLSSGATTTTISYAVIEWQKVPAPRATRIRSIQRGTISLSSVASATASISPVNTGRAILRLVGWTMSTGITDGRGVAYMVFTNTTTITATRNTVASGSTVMAYEITEMEDINVAA
jgi:hypothetical protein